LLLFLVWLGSGRARQPARRQRLAEWSVVAALVVAVIAAAPPWIVIPVRLAGVVPAVPPPAHAMEAVRIQGDDVVARAPETLPPDSEAQPVWQGEPVPADDAEPAFLGAPPSDSTASAEAAPAAESARETIVPAWVLVPAAAYAACALLLAARWLFGWLGLRRLLRGAVPAPAPAAQLFAQMAEAIRPRPRLLVSERLRVPFSCGLRQPTVIVPRALCRPEAARVLRWVFAHELAHIRRRDAWSCLVFNVGQIVYFYLPWFWWLQRQVRLCREYIADAAAVEQEGGAEDYAQLLLGFANRSPVPIGATGVSGHASDLFRRIAMLLENPVRVEPGCPRRWSLAAAGGLLTVAVLIAGVGLRAEATPLLAGPAAQAPAEDPFAAKPKSSDGVFDVLLSNATDEQEKVTQELQEKLKKLEAEAAKLQQEIRKGQQLPLQGFTYQWGTPADGRLGVHVDQPSPTLADQLGLAKNVGLVIEQVVPDSPAAKAGLKVHDVLLELNGESVTNDPQTLRKLVDGIKAKTPVSAVVLRKGKKETIEGITLPEARAQENPFQPRGMPGFRGFGQGFGQDHGGGQGFSGGGSLGGGQGFGGGSGGFGQGYGLGGGFSGNFPGGRTVMTTTFRNADRFTTRHQEGSLIITVTGKVADGKSQVNEIQVQDGGQGHRYKSVDNVPEQYRDKVKNLLEMTEHNNSRIEIRAEEEKKPKP
jgi:beta-lactamase regulating signal transducer with metallopeptidase domain